MNESGFTERWLHSTVKNGSVHLGLFIVFPIKIIDICTYIHITIHQSASYKGARDHNATI